jgi:hypothetical protein
MDDSPFVVSIYDVTMYFHPLFLAVMSNPEPIPAMQEAYFSLAGLNPLSPNASPRSAQRYRKLICSINGYIGRMTEYVEGVATASHIDTNFEGMTISFV